MNKREFLQTLTAPIGTGFSATLGFAQIPPRSRQKSQPFSLIFETRLGEYLAKSELRGEGKQIHFASLALFPLLEALPNRKPTSVLTLLREETALLEPEDPIRGFRPVIYELGGQPRFVIVTVPLGPRHRMRILGNWWFLVDQALKLGSGVNIASQEIGPQSWLLVQLATGTRGIIL